MDPTGVFCDKADCTTCFFSENFSNYWTAVLYFKARNGTYKKVPLYANADLEGSIGGMTIYIHNKISIPTETKRSLPSSL
jgi:hypothetical protein